MIARLGIGVAGLAIAAFGFLRLFQTGWRNLENVLLWLAGGVIVHDFFIAPLTILLVLIGGRLLPRRHRGRIMLAAIVIATVTLTAVPVLGRFGARSDNPTLLNRNYAAGWLVFVALVLVCTLVSGIWSRRRRE